MPIQLKIYDRARPLPAAATQAANGIGNGRDYTAAGYLPNDPDRVLTGEDLRAAPVERVEALRASLQETAGVREAAVDLVKGFHGAMICGAVGALPFTGPYLCGVEFLAEAAKATGEIVGIGLIASLVARIGVHLLTSGDGGQAALRDLEAYAARAQGET